MKYVKEAVRYCLETMDIEPDELFRLFEFSKGYNGDDYRTWLAGKVVELAESRDIGMSKLMVKKFHILQELKEEYVENNGISNEAWNYIVGELDSEFGKYVTYEISGREDGLESDEEVNWLEGMDYGLANDFFIQDNEWLQDKLNLPFVFDLSSMCEERVDKKASSEILASAKERGITIENNASLMLHRLCSMEENHETARYGACIILPVGFLQKMENWSVIKELLWFYDVSGVVANSKLVYGTPFNLGMYAVLILRERTDGSKTGGVYLKKIDSWDCMADVKAEQCSLSEMSLEEKIAEQGNTLRRAVVLTALNSAFAGIETVKAPVEMGVSWDELSFNSLVLSGYVLEKDREKLVKVAKEQGMPYLCFEAKNLLDDLESMLKDEELDKQLVTLHIDKLKDYLTKLYRKQYTY